MLMKLACDWFLTDGILTDVRLGAPMRVMDALKRTGVISDDDTIPARMKNEWAFRRTWRYYTRFTAPESALSRRFFIAEGLSGTWKVSVNGQELIKGSGQRLEEEVTLMLAAGENLAEIEFMPAENEDAVYESGFFGQVFMRITGDSEIEEMHAEVIPGEGISPKLRINALRSENALLNCLLCIAGKSYEKSTDVSLLPGNNEFAFDTIPCETKGQKYSLTVRIKNKDGVSLDEQTTSGYISHQSFPMRGFQTFDAFDMSLSQRTGANCAYFKPSPRLMSLAADRMLTAKEDASALYEARPASQRTDTLSALTGDDPSLFEEGKLFRVSGVKETAFHDLYALAGDKKTDAEFILGLSRYIQAVSLRKDAENARRKGADFIVTGVRHHTPRAVSSALFDSDDRPRPAYFALANAWKSVHAFVSEGDLSAEDGILALPVYFVSDHPQDEVYTVNAKAYAIDGRELLSANFPALGNSADAIGRLCTELPEDGLLAVRVRVLLSESVISSSDYLFSYKDGAIGDIRSTQLLLRGNTLENAGSTCAVGVSIPGADYFGILLPGEKITIPDGKPNRAEGLNVIY